MPVWSFTKDEASWLRPHILYSCAVLATHPEYLLKCSQATRKKLFNYQVQGSMHLFKIWTKVHLPTTKDYKTMHFHGSLLLTFLMGDHLYPKDSIWFNRKKLIYSFESCFLDMWSKSYTDDALEGWLYLKL